MMSDKQKNNVAALAIAVSFFWGIFVGLLLSKVLL